MMKTPADSAIGNHPPAGKSAYHMLECDSTADAWHAV